MTRHSSLRAIPQNSAKRCNNLSHGDCPQLAVVDVVAKSSTEYTYYLPFVSDANRRWVVFPRAVHRATRRGEEHTWRFSAPTARGMGRFTTSTSNQPDAATNSQATTTRTKTAAENGHLGAHR